MLGPQLLDKLVTGLYLFHADCRFCQGTFELPLGCCGIQLFHRDRPAGEDRYRVVGDLDESTFQEKTFELVSRAQTQFPGAEPSDHRRVVGQDAHLSINKRYHDRFNDGFDRGLLGGHNNAIYLAHYLSILRHRLCLFLCLLDGTDVHERLLGQVIPLAITEFFKAADGIFQRCDFPGFACEYLGNQEGL